MEAPPLTTTQTISLIGLGHMGIAIARHLLKSDGRLAVWNRTPSKAEPLVKQGATLATTPSECVAASQVIIFCLLSDAATQAVLCDIQDFRDKVIINLTNGTPGQAREMAAYVSTRGARAYLHGAVMVPPPLVGQPDAVTLYSGPLAAFESSSALTTALGAAKYVGDDPGLASLLDNSLLSIMGGLFEGFVQSLALVNKAGVNEVDFATDLALPILKAFLEWLPRIAGQVRSRMYKDGSTLNMQLEALDNIASTGRELGIDAVLMGSLRELMKEAVQRGKGEESIASLVGMLTS